MGRRAEHRFILKIAANLRITGLRFSRLNAVTATNGVILAINYNVTAGNNYALQQLGQN